jgi:iron complex transport system substrate-binding protein
MRLFVRIALLLTLLSLSLPLAAAQDAPFTIAADAALQPAIDALYSALYDGAAPAYVSADADLLAEPAPESALEGISSGAGYYLPDAVLRLQTDNTEASAFVDFAISPDGQKALIDAGFLPDSVTFTDQAGLEVTLPQPVRRVVSPYSLSTYLVYGVGAAERLSAGGFLGARDPIGAARMELIDPRFPVLSGYVMNQREINVEEIAVLMPDAIFTTGRASWLDTVAELGIPTVLFEGETPERMKESMLISGQIFGPHAQATAQAWVEYYDTIFNTVLDATGSLTDEERPSVLVVGEEALRVASGQMYQSEIVAAAGGASVTTDLTGHWNDVNLEQVIVWDPDVIVIVPYGTVTPEAILTSPEWQAVSAVQNGRVYKMPAWVAPWDSPVPDSVLGIIWLAQTLYQDEIALDCTTEAIKFFDTFYQYAVPEDEIAAVCGS